MTDLLTTPHPNGSGDVTAVTIDPWDPGYAAAVAGEALTELDASAAELRLDIETPTARWAPLDPNPDAAPPQEVLVTDGVRRIDARLWVDDPDGGTPLPGIAASYAAGVVRCGIGNGDPATLADIRVDRRAFTTASHCPDLPTAFGNYLARMATKPTPEALSIALQQQLTNLEVTVATEHRQRSGFASDLLIIDGPLRGRTHLDRAVGYVKTHHTAYLPSEQAKVVTALAAGQRSPLFLMGTSWSRHAWYLRLPTRSPAPWAGVVRCEASPDLTVPDVAQLADLTARLLPTLAGIDYKDPRAPQNLVPLGGLEKLLRHRLGDTRLLYRALRSATHA